MGLAMVLKLIYTLYVLTIASTICSANKEEIKINHPPCIFNPLCSCSKTLPDLGIVECRNVPFPNIPKAINISKVYSLAVENTGLQKLEPYFLQATGLYQLEISNNKLTFISDDAFYGLERSLWELYLQNNDLTDIPFRALKNLQNLKVLDLHGNEINYFDQNAWIGIGNSLKTLNLAQNSISTLIKDSFNGLPLLETLDLSGNNIMEIDPNIFKNGLGRISKLLLADNLLSTIPYIAVSPLRVLRHLNLSYNRIKNVLPEISNLTVKLALDTLHLEYNFIDNLETNSFNNFEIVNRTFLDGNIIKSIDDSAFQHAKIRELYLRSCSLQNISPSAFDGLENTLQILDLSNNNISEITEKLLQNFTVIGTINVNDNNLGQNFKKEMLSGIHQTLNELEIESKTFGLINLQNIKSFRNLRTLAIIDLPIKSISSNDFLDYESNIEKLKITRSGINKIGPNTFSHCRAIKELDLSENEITNIDKDAFIDIGHTLNLLIISHGFATQTTTLPSEPFKHLASLQVLDISNNKLKIIQENSFHFLRNLKLLRMHDNQIERIVKGTFQDDLHCKLEEILLSFNHIGAISQNTFADISGLQLLLLDDNRIEKIEKQSFTNLISLKYLNLRGNKINNIEEEAFVNLPRLEHLDASYNSLTYFDFKIMDQVGSLSSLHANFSHNKINELVEKNETRHGTNFYDSNIFSNIRIFDLSNNNISNIQWGYFKPVELSLTHLYLSQNKIKTTSREIFGNLYHLQWLDLSHNVITEISSTTFQLTRKLQVLRLSNNKISNISVDLFRSIQNLRIVDLSYNNIKSLPDSLFFDDELETLDISHNQLIKVPTMTFTNIAALSLSIMDLSHNNIGAIHGMDFAKFRSITALDLSNNRLIRIEDAVFASLFHLSFLDLSNNNEIDVTGKTFVGLENSLVELRLNNLSLEVFPELSLSHLRTLRISYNRLSSIPMELAGNISSIRHFDLSYNNLSSIPLITHSLPFLKSLSIAGNPIKVITNATLMGAADTLEYLDISKLSLSSFELGALDSISNLRTLKISSYSNIKRFNIPQIIQHVSNLRSLWIYDPVSSGNIDGMPNQQIGFEVITDLRREMDGLLPEKLREIIISGTGFQRIAENILNGVQSPKLHFSLRNTSVSGIPDNFFKNSGNIRNISVDLSYKNQQLRKISNPNTFEKIPQKMFLTDIKISGNILKCDCDIGWIEFWLRKKRQYICTTSDAHEKYWDVCKQTNDLREVKCENKNHEKLIEVLKTDIECGWGSSARRPEYTYALIILPIIFTVWI